jgi:acyl transferase domain-containing protein
MIGHSLGEYTAALLAGVFQLRDSLRLVTLRGRLFEKVPQGGMLSVQASAGHLATLMPAGLSIAAVNAPELSVASGPLRELAMLEKTLEAVDISFTRIRIDVAAHSSMLEPVLDEFRGFVRSIKLSAPSRPFVSNLTGTWISDTQAADPEY